MATNLLTSGQAYNPYFYANKALEQLNKRLGMAFYVNRQIENEKGLAKGDKIRVRKPAKFTTLPMPIAEASAQDVTPEYQEVSFDFWEGTMFQLTDRELTFTIPQFVDEHITPMAIAAADKLDQTLCALALEIPWIVNADGTDPYKDFANLQKVMFDNLNPRNAELYYQMDSVLQLRYNTNPSFFQLQSGTDAGELQREGRLAKKWGFEPFANQNSITMTAGSATFTTVVAGNTAKGSTTIALTGATLTGTIKRGVVLTIAGHTQKYAVKADVTASGNAATVVVSPVVQVAISGSPAVTADQTAMTSCGLGFQRNAFCLVTAPLSMLGGQLGAKMATVTDPITNITLRSTMWYTGGGAQVFVRIDLLWGVYTLDANMAARIRV